MEDELIVSFLFHPFSSIRFVFFFPFFILSKESQENLENKNIGFLGGLSFSSWKRGSVSQKKREQRGEGKQNPRSGKQLFSRYTEWL